MTSILSAFSVALLHFAWQGLLVFGLLWVTLFALRKHSANTRYAASCVALAALAAAPAVTTYSLYHRFGPPSPRAPVVSAISAPHAAGPYFPPHQTPLASVERWVLPVWAFGVLILSFRMIWACTQVAVLRRRGQPADSTVLSLVANLSRRLGLSKQPRVLISGWQGGPSLVGWLRPVILVPASAIAGLTPEQLEAVLAHELAHIRRHDYLVNWMQLIVETLLFYHPAVWWISSRIRHERELCCDDLAVSACAGPMCYARALTSLEKMRAGAPALALGSTDGPLFYRIQRIVGATAEQCGPSRASGIVALSLALLCLVIGVNWAQGQNQPLPDYLVQGDLLLRAGANDLALQKYREGMASDPGKKAVYQKRCIEVLMRMEKKAEAYELNAELLKEHPDDGEARSLQAASQLERDPALASAQLQQVIQRTPNNPVAHFNLGLAYKALHQDDAARRELEEAVRLRPDYILARRELENLILDPGKRPEPPNSSDVLAQSGGSGTPAAGRNQFEEALNLLQSESAKAPDRLDLMMELGNLATRAGNYDLAINSFQRLLDRMDQNSDERGGVYYRLGEAYRRKGDSAAAIQALEKARGVMPDNRDVLMSLITALEAAGRSAEAIQLRELAEATRRTQEETTTNFLNEELAFEEKRLEAAQRDTPQQEELLRKLRSAVEDLLRRQRAVQEAWRPAGHVLSAIELRGLPDPALAPNLPVRLGDTLSEETVMATRLAVTTFDPSLEVQITPLENGTAVIRIVKPRR